MEKANKKSKAKVCWHNMMSRCYGNNKEAIRGYGRVCPEWQVFENFEKWYNENYYEGAELDKDWKGYNCRYYHPENCVFMPRKLNLMMRVEPIGEHDFEMKNGKFYAHTWIDGKQKYLGKFEWYEDAVKAVIKAKREYCINYANELKEQGERLGKMLISEDAYNAVINRRWS